MSAKPAASFWPFVGKVIVLHRLAYVFFGILLLHVNLYPST